MTVELEQVKNVGLSCEFSKTCSFLNLCMLKYFSRNLHAEMSIEMSIDFAECVRAPAEI